MFGHRVEKIRQKLAKEKLDAVLVSSAANITYLTGYENFSLTEREAYVFLGRNFAYIITDGRYSEAVKKQVPHLTLFERGHKNPIENLFKKHKVRNLGIEENSLTVVEHKSVRKHFKNTAHFEVSRSIKTKEEIDKIAEACKIGDLAFEYILKKIKVGQTEKKVAGIIENFIKSKGGEFSFPAIVAFGKNSSVPHHQTGDKRLTINDKLILLDFGVKLDNYCSDMTRTIFFGKPTEKQNKIYEDVLEAQHKAVKVIKQGERQAAKIFKAAGLEIPHSLGHGIGLEVHEHPSLSPKSKEVLREGMVFSIEPGIYLEGLGGVRIEDLFVFTKNGLKQLTHAPVKIKII